MKKIMISILILTVIGACSARKNVVNTELSFANKLAKEGLWKEAHYRWKKVLAEGKDTAALHNNIAIALEKMGKFEEAKAEYKKALAIAPNNPTIKGNYDKFMKYLKNEDDKTNEEKDKNEKRKERKR